MNKTELTAAVVAKTGMTKKDADKALTAVLDAISESLQAGEKGRSQRGPSSAGCRSVPGCHYLLRGTPLSSPSGFMM